MHVLRRVVSKCYEGLNSPHDCCTRLIDGNDLTKKSNFTLSQSFDICEKLGFPINKMSEDKYIYSIPVLRK